jgi:hypothetical protein
MASVALLDPPSVDVKVTLIVQFAPARSDPPQLLVCAKSPAFVPPMAKLDSVRDTKPVLVRVMVCAAVVVALAGLVNDNDSAESATKGGSGTTRTRLSVESAMKSLP